MFCKTKLVSVVIANNLIRLFFESKFLFHRKVQRKVIYTEITSLRTVTEVAAEHTNGCTVQEMSYRSVGVVNDPLQPKAAVAM